MNAPLLCCRGLEAGYGTSRVLFGLDFDIRAGEVVALLGRNGMGKSTTIRTIVGGLRPQRGEIVFDGRPIHAERADAIARLGVAIVPEGRQCFPNLTVHEHLVAFAARRNGVAEPWTPARL
ncbi:MAG: ATP-binding cassette domain-containing protein, partial [Thauera sp.]|nr:ATP-binding cassette domain-containing protein [Thauera sp.]